MGRKYIIEIIGGEEGDMDFSTIEPYTEPDMEQVRKEAYAQGYSKGFTNAKVQCNIQAEKDLREVGERHYQKGLSDAWEAARKIANMPYDEEEKAFGSGGWTFIEKHTASEAIERIRQYEEKEEKEEKEQIQIGDEVVNMQTGVRFIVTHIWFNNHGEQGVSGFNHDCSAFSTTLSLVVKTGRHFPEITEVLRKMRENTNG